MIDRVELIERAGKRDAVYPLFPSLGVRTAVLVGGDEDAQPLLQAPGLAVTAHLPGDAEACDGECWDLVYLDVGHDYEQVKAALSSWAPKVRQGGILAGHDYVHGYMGQRFGVKEAVKEFARQHGLRVAITRADHLPSWWMIMEGNSGQG